MKVISIGTDRKLFEENSAVRQRQIEYGKFFEEMHIVVFTAKSLELRAESLKIGNNIWLYPTNSKNKFLYVWDAFCIVKTISSKLRASSYVVTTQDPFETGIVGVLAKLFFGLPLHIQVHTDLMHKYFRQASLLNRVRFFMAQFILRYADRVRVVSERVKKSISPFNKNIDVLPIKAEIFQGESLNNFAPKASPLKKPFPFTILMVCRLEKEKNIKLILRVVKNLKEKEIGLCVVGDGSQKANLEKMAKDLGLTAQAGTSDRVVFAGWKDNLTPYYKMADVFVSSSLYEGYGLSTVEAAYFRKPLILSETGVAGEIFKENESALIYDAKDSNCFAQSILKIYQDKNLATKVGQSAKIAADKHINSETNYFKKYADSIIETANNLNK